MKKILVINGPNINLLGTRETNIYGDFSLAELQQYTDQKLSQNTETSAYSLDWFQSNLEGEIIKKIHGVINSGYEGLIINPAGYSHTSVAILDALKILKIPVLEVHLSNVYQRESFRQTLLTAQAASMIMSGLGKEVYHTACYALKSILNKE